MKSHLAFELRTGAAWLALPILLGAGTPAFAQASDSTQASTGGEIVVTAQRREERAKDVPITLTAISAERLGQGDVNDLSDVQKLTPALRFDNQGGFAQPTIRGVGTAVSASGSGSNVGIYVDGFYAPNPLTADFQLLNVTGVTVLKGPQGTLFGRNSTGGAIQVTTGKPSTKPGLVAEASYGSYNAQRYQAYGTAGLSDNVAFECGGPVQQGQRLHQEHRHQEQQGRRLRKLVGPHWLMVDLGGSNSLLLRYTHSSVDDPTSLASNAFVDPVTGAVESTGAIIPGVIVATKPNEVSNTSPTSFTSKVDAVQLTGQFDLGFATLTSYTQYRSEDSTSFLDLDSSSAKLFDVDFNITDKIFTQEFLLNSAGDGPFKWTVGAFFFSDKNRFNHLDGYNGGVSLGTISKSQTDSQSIALYADGTYQIGEKFFVTAGLRYSNDKVKNGAFTVGPIAAALGLYPTPGFFPIPDVTYNKVDPRVVLRFKPNAASSLYRLVLARAQGTDPKSQRLLARPDRSREDQLLRGWVQVRRERPFG